MASSAPKIGILGGSFDPIHYGHIHIAEAALDLLRLKQVWFVPTYHSPFNPKPPEATPHQRLMMTELALRYYPYFEFLDWEIERRGMSYTIDTVEQLRRVFPEYDFSLILTTELFASLHKWERAQELVNQIELIVVNRAGAEFKEPQGLEGMKVHRITCKENPISSTEIRKRVKDGRSIDKMLPDPVINYITINKIYRGH